MKKLITSIIILCSITTFAQQKLSVLEQEGTNYFNAGDVKNAKATFEKALVQSPNSLYSINALTTLYHNGKEEQKAYDMADKGMKLSGGAANFVYAKARAATILFKPNDAIAIIESFAAKNKADFKLLFVKASAYKQLGDKQQAITAYSQSIADNPDFFAYFYRGQLFADLERYPQAIKDYEKCIELDKDFADVYNYLGVAYFLSGNVDAALTNYNICIALDPKQSYAITNRGVVFRDKLDFQKADNDFETSININPNDGNTYFEYAHSLRKTKNYVKAAEMINKALALKPNRALFYIAKSSIYNGLDKYEDAMVAADKAVELEPKNPEGFLLKAVTYYNQGKFNDALITATNGIAIQPNNYYLLFSERAFIYRKLNNIAAANADDAKAKEIASK